MTSHEPVWAMPGRLEFVKALLLASAVGVLAGCGGSETPEVCDSLETLSGSVNELQDLDPEVGEGAVADIEESLDSIRTDVEAVKGDAEAELSEPISDLETSLDALSTDLDAVQATGDVTSASAQAIGDSLAAVSTSWEALTTSVPDCDL